MRGAVVTASASMTASRRTQLRPLFCAAALCLPLASPAPAQTVSGTAPGPDARPTLLETALERAGTVATTGPGGNVTAGGNQNALRPAVQAEGRACDGCPWRRPGTALLQTTAVNVVYGLGNLARGQVTARVTPATWWANMEHGWVWDLDDFVVNQFGHPYQGSNYFNTGRGEDELRQDLARPA